MKTEVKEIKKGIKLHIIKNDKFKTNLISIFITSKLTRENVTKNALIPAVLQRGSKKMQTQEEISKKLESMYGASLGCGIDKIGDNHVIKFYLESINDNFVPKNEELMKNSIDMLLEIVLNPYLENDSFKNDYVQTEKDKIKQIIEGKINNKDLYAYTRCIEEMFKEKPYSLYKYGYIEDLQDITPQSLFEHYKKILQNSKIDIFISGNIENVDNIIQTIEQDENIQKLKERNPEYIINNENTETVGATNSRPQDIKTIQEKMDISQGKLIIGMDVLSDKEDSRFKTVVYNTILGDSANSKLFQNVREKAHLAYTVRSMYNKQKSCIFIRAGIEVENYQKAVDIIKEQIENMKNGDFTQEDIKNAKNDIVSSIDSIEEEQDTEIMYYLGQELSESSYTPEEYKQKIQAVTKEQIEETANEVKTNTIYFLSNS